MAFGLSDRGEELQYTSGFVGQTVEVTMYDDSTDGLSDSDGTGAVSTEPSVTRESFTVQSSDIQQYSGDYGFERTVTVDVSGTSASVDGILLVEDGTNNIIARAEIQNPQPGPKQDLAGLSSIELTPRLTTD